MILADKTILERMRNNKFGDQIAIYPWDPDSLTPQGVDFKIGHFLESSLRASEYMLPTDCYTMIGTLERLRVPTDLCAQIWLKTYWVRKGIQAVFGIIDAGFEGNLTLSVYNASDKDIKFEIGQNIVQVCFISLTERAEKSYVQRSGNYQNQNGITGAKT